MASTSLTLKGEGGEEKKRKVVGEQAVPAHFRYFREQDDLTLKMQMSMLDDRSLRALCSTDRRAAALCADERQRTDIEKRRFEFFLGAELAAQLSAQKVGMFGAAFPWRIFYATAVTAYEKQPVVRRYNIDIVSREPTLREIQDAEWASSNAFPVLFL